MPPSDRPPTDGPPVSEQSSEAGAPYVLRTANKVEYHFPVEIVVGEDGPAAGELEYHFPVEVVLGQGERAVDVQALADLVLERLAQRMRHG